MKRTIYLISFLLCFLLSLMCLSATLTGINNGANIGSIVILVILCGIFLLTGIFLCRKHNKQSKPDNSEFDMRVKEYHENSRPLNWFNWQVVILPVGITLSIITICSNILTASSSFVEPYKTATYLLTILDVVAVVFAIRARAYAKYLTLKSYKSFIAYYIYLPIPLFVTAVTYIFLTLDEAENIAAMIVGDYFGRFIVFAIFSILCIVYFRKRKNLFADNDLNKENEEVKNGQQLTLFSVDEEAASSVKNASVNDTANTSISVAERESTIVKEKAAKIRFCKFCGAEIDCKTKKCTNCGKQYFKMIYGIIIVSVLLLILTASVVAYNIGASKGYSEGKTENTNTTTNSDWKESAKKSLENSGYYENETPQTSSNSYMPSVPSNSTSYEKPKKECLSAMCDNEVNGFSSYCMEHRCQWPDCNFARGTGGYYCSSHTCNDVGCKNPIIANYKSYCENHTCYYPGCTSGQSFNSYYCLRHKN